MTKNAIIISKNQNLCKLVENELLLHGFAVKTCDVSIADTDAPYDVIIADITSLETNAFTALRSFLSKNAASLKICISEGDDTPRTPWGFNKYLSFPFHLGELRKAFAMTNIDELKNDIEKIPDTSKCFFAHKDRHGVTFEGTYVPLSEYEFSTLELLCKNSGNCVGRDELRKILNSTDGNISDVYISHLRSKLEAPFGLKIIYTVRSKGYMTDYTMREYLP